VLLSVDNGKLRDRKIRQAPTGAEALNRALDIVAAEARIDATLRGLRGKVRLRKVFR
jgi:hypothetical protein